jgi:hypothetical protein
MDSSFGVYRSVWNESGSGLKHVLDRGVVIEAHNVAADDKLGQPRDAGRGGFAGAVSIRAEIHDLDR